MIYHLTALGIGLATERAPVLAKGKVKLTFKGCFADSVCVGSCFYPILDGVAEIPADAFSETTSITAHALAEGKLYVCDPIGRLKDGTLSYLMPLVNHGGEATVAFLAQAIGDLEGRLDEVHARLSALTARIEQKPFIFGGTV
ncbi:MAG: hypothetical protein J6T24_04760 [Clostridia bacterium]|nr:hypothetical protein [Clostridia bacterium]